MTLPWIGAADLPRLAYSHHDDHDPSLTSPEHFREIISRGEWVKPAAGGLWTSPVTATAYEGGDWWIIGTAWTDWCLSEEWGTDQYVRFQEIAPLPEFRGLRIDSLGDIKAIVQEYGVLTTVSMWACLDWERMAKDGVDAVYLTDLGQCETRHPEDRGLSMYGWDSATVLWLRPTYRVVS